jgi:hypothetical protein
MNKYIVLDIVVCCSNDLDRLIVWTGLRYNNRAPKTKSYGYGYGTGLSDGMFLHLRRSDTIGMVSDNDVYEALEGPSLAIVEFLLERLLEFYKHIWFVVDINAAQKFRDTCLAYANASEEEGQIRSDIAEYLKKRLQLNKIQIN